MGTSGIRGARWHAVALSAGMLAGLVLALASLAGPLLPDTLPDDAVARVNGTVVSLEAYEQALAALAADKREALTDADRRRVLERLVDEELLVQHAQATGLDREAPLVRKTLVAAVLDSNRAQAETAPVAPEDVAAFHALHREYFARPPALHVRAWRCADRATCDRLAAAVRRGADASLSGVEAMPVPDGPVPVPQLRPYLGGRLTELAQALPGGETSAPLSAGDSWYVLHMVRHEEGRIPPIEEIRDEVERELRRRRAEETLRELLDGLRRAGTVVIRDAS